MKSCVTISATISTTTTYYGPVKSNPETQNPDAKHSVADVTKR